MWLFTPQFSKLKWRYNWLFLQPFNELLPLFLFHLLDTNHLSDFCNGIKMNSHRDSHDLEVERKKCIFAHKRVIDLINDPRIM